MTYLCYIHQNKIIYVRFEIPRISRVGDTFAITFYQIDYNNYAERCRKEDRIDQLDAAKQEVIVVSKMATSYQGLLNLKNSIDEFLATVEKGESK